MSRYLGGKLRTSVKGPTGEPTRLLETVLRMSVAAARPGGTFSLRIEHDAGCPCLSGSGMAGCTCETANVSVDPVECPE